MGVRIRGILTTVPTAVRTADDLAEQFGREETDRRVEMTGVRKVRFVSANQTLGDLSYEAAARLLAKLDVSPRDVQGIIFISQTADFDLPATACILQNRLGLPKQSLAFDVSLGCSSYPYGLAIASSLISAGLAKRILLLTADTSSKIINKEDRATWPLFGDAAVATLLEADPNDNDLLGLDLGTDGAGWLNLVKAVGQCRYPSTNEFLAMRPESLSKIQYPEHVYMNGAGYSRFVCARFRASFSGRWPPPG